MNIVTTYFLVKRVPGSICLGDATLSHAALRQAEYVDCIRRNLLHPHVSSLHLLVEGREAYSHLRQNVLHGTSLRLSLALRRKLVPVPRHTDVQPTYADLFRHADQLLRGQLVMICNADIYLPPHRANVGALATLVNASQNGGNGRVALALTRYESEDPHDAALVYDYRGSHDAFVVRPPFPVCFMQKVQHRQNCYKAENIVLYELRRSGYAVVNPCMSFMIVHQHAADVRQWLPAVDEQRYARAAPCTIEEAFHTIRSVGGFGLG